MYGTYVPYIEHYGHTPIQRRLQRQDYLWSVCQFYQTHRRIFCLKRFYKRWACDCTATCQLTLLPANGILNGSVQYMPENPNPCWSSWIKKKLQLHDGPNLVRAIRELLTAKDNSIGSSGGMTDVSMRVHSRKSLYLLRPSSWDPGSNKSSDPSLHCCQYVHTYT